LSKWIQPTLSQTAYGQCDAPHFLRHPRRAAEREQNMPANHFVLKGSGVEVDYTIGANPSFIALTYKSGSVTKQYKPAQIETDNTGLGDMVSIALTLTVDAGGERFGMFLPVIDVPQGQTVDFNTVGVYATSTGPDALPHGTPSWRCIEMCGTAQTVAVPLVEPATA
jgi:hypothetical protein